MKQKNPLFKGLLMALVLALVPLACSKKPVTDTASLPTDDLIVVSVNQRYLLDEFGNAFNEYYKKKHNRAVKFEWLDLGGTSDAVKFVTSEFSKKQNGINVDIFWGGGPTPHYVFKEKGILAPFKPSDEILSHIPQKIAGMPVYDPEFYWMGSVLSSFGFTCNEQILRLKKMKAPTSWEGLGDPKFFGQFGNADPRHSGSMHTIYGIILQAYGWEKGWEVLHRMGANVRQFRRNASDIIKDVAVGDSLCGLCIDFYAWAKIDELGPENISFTLPEKLSVINTDPISILKGAPHRPVAEEFVSFVLSKEGQALWMLPKGHPQGPKQSSLNRPSIIPALYDEYKDDIVISINPYKLEGYLNYDENEASELWGVINDMAGLLIVDSKVELAEAWGRVIKKGPTPEMLAILGSVPIDRKTAYLYAKNWKDEVFRNKILNEWQAFNKKKFRKLTELSK